MKECIAFHMKLEHNMLTMINEFDEKLEKEKNLSLRIKQRENAFEVEGAFKDNLLNGLD